MLGLTIGLTVIIVMAAANVLFLLILARTPVNWLTPLWVTLILLSLFVAYRTLSLLNTKYIITQNAMVIVWGWVREIIPMGEINTITHGKLVSARPAPRGLWWPGCLVGRGRSETLGELAYFATAPQEEQLFVATSACTYVISPSDLNQFLAEFEGERQKGITEPVGFATHRPAFYDWDLWRDRWAAILIGVGLALPFLLMIVIALRIPSLPSTIPLHFNIAGQPDRIGSSAGLFNLVFIGGLVWLVNSLAGVILHIRRTERPAAYLLWLGSSLVQVFLWVAAIGLL
jgi:hypothetical protein